MSSAGQEKVPAAVQPRPENYDFDLDSALGAMVAIHATIPEDAFTAGILGTERAGNGVLIRGDGLVLTIGYLITEAESVWLRLSDGRSVPGHVLGYDQESGLGLVQALARIDRPVLPLGDSDAVESNDPVVVGGAGGRKASVAAHVQGKQEFAGYWEYLLEQAIFTSPAHPNWGGTALIGAKGELLGIGSLQLQQAGSSDEDPEHLNMIVPVNLLKPVLDDLVTIGRPNRPARPWLGFYAAEIDDRLAVVGLADGGPAAKARLKAGDIILSVAGEDVNTLASLFRRIWSLGQAGVEVPILVYRDRRPVELRIRSVDRFSLLKAPSLH